jgi:hypothetical protein
MTRLPTAIRELHRSEHRLASALAGLADRHRVDHDLHHVGRDLSDWSLRHATALAEAGQHFDLGLDPHPTPDPTVIDTEREHSDDLFARSGDPGLLMLSDLRLIHRMAAHVSLDWEVLAQTAQALADTTLLGMTKTCHPETLRQMRWANASLKENAAQIMVSD